MRTSSTLQDARMAARRELQCDVGLNRPRRDAVQRRETEHLGEQSSKVHGVCKVWRQLCRAGVDVVRCRVARLVRGMGIGARAIGLGPMADLGPRCGKVRYALQRVSAENCILFAAANGPR